MTYYFDIYKHAGKFIDNPYYISYNNIDNSVFIMTTLKTDYPLRRGIRGEFLLKQGDYVHWTPATSHIRIE